MSTSISRWVIVGLYLIIIFAATYIIRLGGFLDDKTLASKIFLAVYIITAITLITVGLLRFGSGNHFAWLYMGIIAALLMIAVFNLAEPAARLHFLEYGALFVLIYRAFKVKTGGFLAYGLALLATAVCGAFDEYLQSLYRSGIMDYSDVLNNAFAGYLACGATLVWEKC